MLILGLEGTNLDQKGTKMGGLDVSRTVNLNFLKEDHKISFYTKNQQSSTNRLKNISQNVDFGPKMGKFGPKKAQNGWNQIFPGTFTRLFHKKTQNVVSICKIKKIL